MPDETKPMTAVAIHSEDASNWPDDRLKAELQRGFTLSGAAIWLQRALLGMLVVAHCSLPYFFSPGASELIRDSLLMAQVTIGFILLILGGLRLWMIGLVVLLSVIPMIGWYLAIPSYLSDYMLTWLTPYLVCCPLTLIALRFWGWKGTWSTSSDQQRRPLQISILNLLMVTALVAGTLAAFSGLRRWNEAGLERDWQLWINVVVDGLTTATCTVLIVWSMGRRGSPVIRALVLLTALVYLTTCQIYACQMESYWELFLLMNGTWTAVTLGTLIVWRVCGWHVVVRQRDGSFA